MLEASTTMKWRQKRTWYKQTSKNQLFGSTVTVLSWALQQRMRQPDRSSRLEKFTERAESTGNEFHHFFRKVCTGSFHWVMVFYDVLHPESTLHNLGRLEKKMLLIFCLQNVHLASNLQGPCNKTPSRSPCCFQSNDSWHLMNCFWHVWNEMMHGWHSLDIWIGQSGPSCETRFMRCTAWLPLQFISC